LYVVLISCGCFTHFDQKSNKTYQKEQAKKKSVAEKIEKEKQEKERIEREKESKLKKAGFLKKYKNETNILSSKIANRPTKQSLIERGILVDQPEPAPKTMGFGNILSPGKQNRDKAAPAPQSKSLNEILLEIVLRSYWRFYRKYTVEWILHLKMWCLN
jgi:hypothetical protein